MRLPSDACSRGGFFNSGCPPATTQSNPQWRRLSSIRFLTCGFTGLFEGAGWHFLASMRPIPMRTADELVARMPAAAVTDMMEWGPAATPAEEFQRMLSTEMTPQQLIDLAPQTPAMKDDRPVNEYFLLRGFSRLQD